MDTYQLNLKKCGTNCKYPPGTRLEKIVQEQRKPDEPLVVAALYNNQLKELSSTVTEDGTIEFIDLTSLDGIRIYQRSLAFVLIRAAMELFYGIGITVEHSLNKGLYFELHYSHELSEQDIADIKKRMTEIIERDEPFVKESITKAEASELFERHHMESKKKLLKYRESETINVYNLGWLKNYFYGYMVPSTGYLRIFDIKKYGAGLILLHPTKFNPFELPVYEEHPKLASIYKEAEDWGKILEMEFVANLNERIEASESAEYARIAEALHEKKIAQIADLITESHKRLILIAGPSSSGKTTFANRLRIQLKVNGLRPITISTDDYFVNRADTPLDEKGEYDFESIDAVDVNLFNDNLSRLLAGEEVEMPDFNFKTGSREYNGRKMKIGADQPIIIEGIHGLNEKLTSKIKKKDKFKIYISALTSLSIDDHNRIPTTDTRLIRRIVRDAQHRGHSAQTTIHLWPSVRRGEEQNIFPYQEEADVMFNSALAHELAVLKKHAVPLLEQIDESSPEYPEAKRLLKFFTYFLSIEDDSIVPITSILREFVGGSCFRV